MISTEQNQIPQASDPIQEYFGQFTESTFSSEPRWLLPVRKHALAKFSELGFPTKRDEDWRFTNVAPLTKLPFRPATESSSGEITQDLLKNSTFGTLKGDRLVFVDGFFSSALSSMDASSDGISISSLSNSWETAARLLEDHIGKCVSSDDNIFAYLNTAFFQDGTLIHAPSNSRRTEPIHLVFVSTEENPGAAAHLRNLVIAEPGSRLTVTESYFSVGKVPYVTNAFTKFVVGESAVLEHIKFQDESLEAFHMATQHSILAKNSRFVSHSFALGGNVSRNTIRSKLDGEHLECVFNGLYLTRKNQVSDHHLLIDHVQPNCASHEYFNGILDDQSKGVFHGRIRVQPEAQKTDAKQTNKNILLSDSATVDTKPQLEIYADDVKCTHGATVGQLNEESIFYLRTRGIGKETARRMLIHSFAGEIIDRVECEPAREELNRILWDRLEQSPHVSETT